MQGTKEQGTGTVIKELQFSEKAESHLAQNLEIMNIL